jgi:hypothetical protein
MMRPVPLWGTTWRKTGIISVKPGFSKEQKFCEIIDLQTRISVRQESHGFERGE